MYEALYLFTDRITDAMFYSVILPMIMLGILALFAIGVLINNHIYIYRFHAGMRAIRKFADKYRMTVAIVRDKDGGWSMTFQNKPSEDIVFSAKDLNALIRITAMWIKSNKGE